MAQPVQIFNPSLPDNSFTVIDNSAAPSPTTLNAGALLGYDTTVPGAIAQATNPFGNTGSTTLDTAHDIPYIDPNTSTVVGNPVSNISPTAARIVTVANNGTTGVRVLSKNPA